MELKGKTAIVTGGTSGIGFSTAQAFLEKGAKVVVVGRNAQRGENAVAELSKISADVVFYQGDTSDESSVKGLVDFAVEKFGSLDVMVNNAGIGIHGTVDELSPMIGQRLLPLTLMEYSMAPSMLLFR